MKRLLYFILTLPLVLSCSDDPPSLFVAFEPDAPFVTEGYRAEPEKPLKFINESTGAASYKWDFGDGNESTASEPIHHFAKRGDYRVTLEAVGLDGSVKTVEQLVLVGGRSFRNLILNKMPETDANGNLWDTDSGADLLLFFGEADNLENSHILAFPTNIQPQYLPFGGEIFFPEPVFFTNKDWFFMLIDNDAPMEFFDVNDAFMFGVTLNPTQYGDVHLEEGFGRFKLTSGLNELGEQTDQFELIINWDYKLLQ